MLSELQRLLLLACSEADPGAWLAAQAARTDLALDEAERAALRRIDGDGLRVTRLLVQKLRLERLLHGDPAAAAAFAADPANFVARFRRYVAAVPSTAVFPSEEAALFAAFGARDA